MDLFERVLFFAIGGAIGFILGYIVARLREIKEELDTVEDAVTHLHDERGSMHWSWRGLAVILAVGLTAWAAFASQKASNDSKDTQDRLAEITTCNQQYLVETIDALNERTTYSTQQARANVELQKDQARFLTIILKPDAGIDAGDQALRAYFDTLTEFIVVNTKATQKVENNPYPTNEELMSCLVRSD